MINETGRSILKQVAFKGAIELMKGKEINEARTLELSSRFYEWLKMPDTSSPRIQRYVDAPISPSDKNTAFDKLI